MIMTSKHLSKELKNYLEQKRCLDKGLYEEDILLWCMYHEQDCMEAQCFKKYLNSTKRLSELFKALKELEKIEIHRFKDEITKLTKEEAKVVKNYDLLKELSKKYSAYCISIIQKNLLESLNYQVEREYLIYIKLKNVRRNEKDHQVKIMNKKLCCDCSNDIFFGMPCRHILAVVGKDRSHGLESILINKRWQISYYKESLENYDFSENALSSIVEIENSNNLQIGQEILNPDEVIGSGRPASVIQRIPTLSEKIIKKSRKRKADFLPTDENIGIKKAKNNFSNQNDPSRVKISISENKAHKKK